MASIGCIVSARSTRINDEFDIAIAISCIQRPTLNAEFDDGWPLSKLPTDPLCMLTSLLYARASINPESNQIDSGCKTMLYSGRSSVPPAKELTGHASAQLLEQPLPSLLLAFDSLSVTLSKTSSESSTQHFCARRGMSSRSSSWNFLLARHASMVYFSLSSA